MRHAKHQLAMNRSFNPFFVIGLSVMLSNLQAQKLTLKWKTDTLLRVPESVLLDAERFFMSLILMASLTCSPRP